MKETNVKIFESRELDKPHVAYVGRITQRTLNFAITLTVKRFKQKINSCPFYNPITPKSKNRCTFDLVHEMSESAYASNDMFIMSIMDDYWIMIKEL